MKLTLKTTSLLLAVPLMLCYSNQNALAGKKATHQQKISFHPKFNKNVKSCLTYELGLGATASLVSGKRVKNFKDTYEAESENTTVKANVAPLFFGSIGTYAVYRPFTDDFFSKFAASIGFEYYKRGFTERYNLEYNQSGVDVKSKTLYRERYAMNMFALPISFRYGKRTFAELGFVVNNLLSVNKFQKLHQEQTGSGALDGGFDIKDKEAYSLSKTDFKTRSVNVRLGAGIPFSKKSTLRADVMYINKTFLLGNDLRNYVFRLQLNFNILSKLSK